MSSTTSKTTRSGTKDIPRDIKPTRRSSSNMSNFSVASTTLSQAYGSIDNTKAAVVIDIGAKLTKIGCAGDTSPRHIIRTQFIDDNLKLHSSTELLSLARQSSSVPTDDFAKLLSAYFKHLFNLLSTIPRERRVVIVESVLTPTKLRDAICQTVLGILECPSIWFVSSHICATFPFNTQTGLVIDVGYEESIVVPVTIDVLYSRFQRSMVVTYAISKARKGQKRGKIIQIQETQSSLARCQLWQLPPLVSEGVTMLSDWRVSSAVSAKYIERSIRDLLHEHGRIETPRGEQRALTDQDWIDVERGNVIEDVCVGHVICTSRERAGKYARGDSVLDPPATETRLQFFGKTLIIPRVVKETACEVLFDQTKIKEDEKSLPLLLHALVAKLPVDLRRTMFANLLVVGGVSLIPGFQSRLKEEVQAIARTKNLKTADDVKFYQFSNTCAPLFNSWLGGSMIGSLQDVVQHRSLSREDWTSGIRAADWTDNITARPKNEQSTEKTR